MSSSASTFFVPAATLLKHALLVLLKLCGKYVFQSIYDIDWTRQAYTKVPYRIQLYRQATEYASQHPETLSTPTVSQGLAGLRHPLQTFRSPRPIFGVMQLPGKHYSIVRTDRGQNCPVVIPERGGGGRGGVGGG